jgi:hypothetical protein
MLAEGDPEKRLLIGSARGDDLEVVVDARLHRLRARVACEVEVCADGSLVRIGHAVDRVLIGDDRDVWAILRSRLDDAAEERHVARCGKRRGLAVEADHVSGDKS